MEDKTHTLQRWLPILLILAALVWILQDFWSALAWSAVLAVVFWPLVVRIPSRWRSLAALFFAFTAASLILLPLTFVIVEVVRGLRLLGPWVVREENRHWAWPLWLSQHLPTLLLEPLRHLWNTGTSWIVTFLPSVGTRNTLLSTHLIGSHDLESSDALLAHGQLVLNVLGGAEDTALNAGLALLLLFFLLLHGESLSKGLAERISSLAGAEVWMVIARGLGILRGTFWSVVITGIFEAVLFWALYALCGVPHALIWGTVSGVLSVIPFGASAVFIGVTLWIWLAVDHPFLALIIFIAGNIITTLADNLLKPLLIGGRSRMPFMLIFLGLLGGLSVLGILGIFVGPMLMGMLMAWWQGWKDLSMEKLP
ncbi:MAG: AI-2E family transporter [Acidithiobacillus sp.]